MNCCYGVFKKRNTSGTYINSKNTDAKIIPGFLVRCKSYTSPSLKKEMKVFFTYKTIRNA